VWIYLVFNEWYLSCPSHPPSEHSVMCSGDYRRGWIGNWIY
jgi:hypothetical protein